MKTKRFPSIFNDVIGPVMRGPSSSHTAASWRIAKLCVELLNEELDEALIEFDKSGAWAPNYREQGTAMGMDGGLLGIDIRDERIIRPELIAKEKGIHIEYQISSFETDHGNTVRLTLKGKSGKTIRVIAVSTGGGMFEIRQYNEHGTSIQGDNYHLFVHTDKGFGEKDREIIQGLLPARTFVSWSENDHGGVIQARSSDAFPGHSIKRIAASAGIGEVITAYSHFADFIRKGAGFSLYRY